MSLVQCEERGYVRLTDSERLSALVLSGIEDEWGYVESWNAEPDAGTAAEARSEQLWRRMDLVNEIRDQGLAFVARKLAGFGSVSVPQWFDDCACAGLHPGYSCTVIVPGWAESLGAVLDGGA